MFHTNDDSKNERWQSLARNGETVKAITTYRELFGTSLHEAKETVDLWIANQPAGTCLEPIRMSEDEALALVLNSASKWACDTDMQGEERRIEKAVVMVRGLVNNRLDRDTNAKTGPKPPGRHIGHCGHHWLRTPQGEIVVLQWQPATEKWCPSGRVAMMSAVDTTKWTYIAPCPMPLLEEEQARLEVVRKKMVWGLRRDENVTLTTEDKRFLREFLYEFCSWG